MYRSHFISCVLAAGLLLASPLFAELKVDPVYSSHMVLQRGREVPICGTCTEAAPIEVSFAGQKVTATVEGNTWQAVLAPMQAQAKGAALTVTQGAEKVTLEDVVVGEVWVASGQSNMEWRMDQARDGESVNKADLPQLRFYNSVAQVRFGRVVYNEQERATLKAGGMFKGTWSVSSPASCKPMSAVGWYFGRELQKKLGVPVGIIHASLGGSEMVAWLPKKFVAEKYPELQSERWMDVKYIDTFWVKPRALLNLGEDLSTPHPYSPGYLFETGIAPWQKLPVAGVIWYQGESDASVPDMEHNRRMLTDLITGWRAEFKSPELPFIMVQLPRIKDPSPVRALWTEFREVQDRVSREMPQVYSVTTVDLGTTSRDVHPPRKVEVGERMATVAASCVYGKKGEYSGPVIKSAQVKKGEVTLRFSHAKQLRTVDKAAPACFEISEDGTKFVPATAKLKGSTVELSNPEIKNPTYVRYAWSVFLEPNLVNEAGLPTVPFMTQVPLGAK